MSHGDAASSSTSASTIRQVKLEKENELRIEVNNETPLKLRLLDGQAEIFGSELAPGMWLTFPPHLNFAVFTWFGATIEMDGVAETYTADETPMVSYANVHAKLNRRRNRAKAWLPMTLLMNLTSGPRVIVVGPPDSGKSTFSKMLLSWAAKLGWKPTFVDLDVSEGFITIPGCIATTPVELPIDPVEGIPCARPLAYYYGHTTPSNNEALYKALMSKLAQMIETKFTNNAELRTAGMVINTMGWIEGTGCELLLHAIHTFKVDVVLVLGQEKLFNMLRDLVKRKPEMDVVKLHKSGGVVSRNQEFRQKARGCRLREYFYGRANDLAPHSYMANFSDVFVYEIIGGPQATRSALRIGADPDANSLRVTPVNFSPRLLFMVLAVSYATESDQILSSNVAGLIYITDIDFQRERITYLSPSAGELPGKYVIMGTLNWLDS